MSNPNHTARYNSIVTLVARGATEGERKAARAAQVRYLRAHPEVAADCPLYMVAGGNVDDLVGALDAVWTDSPSGGTFAWDEVEIHALLVYGFDFKVILRTLHAFHATRAEGHRNGVYVGSHNLKWLNLTIYALEDAFRETAAEEGMTEAEIKAAITPSRYARRAMFTDEEIAAAG